MRQKFFKVYLERKTARGYIDLSQTPDIQGKLTQRRDILRPRGSFLPLPWVEAAHSLQHPAQPFMALSGCERSQRLNSELPHHDSSQAVCLKQWKRTVLTLPLKEPVMFATLGRTLATFPSGPHPRKTHGSLCKQWSILPGTTLDLASLPWYPSYNR